MRFDSEEQEDYYRHALMALRYLTPTVNWSVASPADVIAAYEQKCSKVPSVPQRDLDYYEKKLNEFPEVKI